MLGYAAERPNETTLAALQVASLCVGGPKGATMKPTAKQLQHGEPMPILTYFWNTPGEWPNDPPGYVFLARAFDEIGSARFVEKWSKKEEKTKQELALVDPDADDLALTEVEEELEVMWVAIKDEIVKRAV